MCIKGSKEQNFSGLNDFGKEEENIIDGDEKRNT